MSPEDVLHIGRGALWIATLLEQFLQTKAEYLQGVHQCLHLLRGGTG